MTVRIKHAGQRTTGPLDVSQSVVKNWRRCQMLYDYRYRQLLERKKPIVQLIRGTIIGKCLDALAFARHKKIGQTIGVEGVLAPYEKQYRRLFSEEQEYYGDVIGETRRIITKYQALYANDGLTYPHVNDEGMPFELIVKVDLDPGIVFTGHVDKLPVDKHGHVWDLDHKTNKNIPDAEDRFADIQQVVYQWALPLSGFPKPSGVIWDYIRTKPPVIPETLVRGGLSQRKNMDTDYDTYLAEVRRLKLPERDYAATLKTLKARGHMDFFERVQLPTPPPEMVKTVVNDLKMTAQEIKRLGGVSKVRSMDWTCKSCEFNKLCQAEARGLDASFIRKADYQIQKQPRHDHSNF